MGNVFGKLNIFKGKLSTMELLASLFIPMSQVYFRLFKLNGTLDKPWLLIPFFLIFPFSVLPTAFIQFGWIKKGEGGPVFDTWMFLPVLFYVLYSMFLEYLDTDFDMLLRLGGLFVSILIPYFIREAKNCKKIGLNQIANILSNSALVLGISYMCLPMIEIGSYLPLVGLVFSILSMMRGIPVIGEALIWGMWYLPTYMFLNVFNKVKGMEKYCGRNHHYILGIVGIVLAIGGYMLDDIMIF